MDTKKKRVEVESPSLHTYTDFTGTYDIRSLLSWVVENKSKWCDLTVDNFLAYVHLDTWGLDFESPTSNLQHLMKDPQEKERVLNADLSYPIVVTNDNKIIDGVHRLFRAIYEGKSTLRGIFVDRSELLPFRVGEGLPVPQTGLDLPIPDLYLRLPKNRLPFEESKRRDVIESYFSDHLPSVVEEEDSWLICLERPQEQYGCYLHDEKLFEGLEWWGENTKVHDIPFQKKIFEKGLLAIEDQWMPYSWSRFFQKNGGIPNEVVLLHLDDHQDMMTPRVGSRLDGNLYDLMSGDSLSLDDPSSVERATLSGAIGKGSILIPLIWSVDKIHVRHLCFRPHPCSHYKIQRATIPDELLSQSNNRISIRLEPTSTESLRSTSNYVVTPDIDEWLEGIPEDVPVLLHFDMDYFNDRFDGNSNWEKELKRIHDVNTENQLKQIEAVFSALERRKLHNKIVNTCIGISPSFYPAEFWSIAVPKVIEECNRLGIL